MDTPDIMAIGKVQNLNQPQPKSDGSAISWLGHFCSFHAGKNDLYNWPATIRLSTSYWVKKIFFHDSFIQLQLKAQNNFHFPCIYKTGKQSLLTLISTAENKSCKWHPVTVLFKMRIFAANLCVEDNIFIFEWNWFLLFGNQSYLMYKAVYNE